MWPNAHAVRADQTHAERADLLDQLILKGPSGRAELGETGRDHDNRFHASRATVFDHREHTLRWNRDDCQIHPGRDIANGSIAAQSAHFGGEWVDRINESAEPSCDNRIEDAAAQV